MKSEFEMSLIEELNFFLGLQIKQTKVDTFIIQKKYTKELVKKFFFFGKELVKKFRLESRKKVDTLVSPTIKLDKSIDFKIYRSMIGSLLYLRA